MSKRILAILLSLLLVFSVCVMSSCKDKSDSSDDSSTEVSEESSYTELEPKSLLMSSLDEFIQSIPQPPASEKADGVFDFTLLNDMKATAKLDINKLNIGGTDYTNGTPLSIDVNAAIDYDSLGIEANASLDYMGENPKFSAIAGDDGFYITDLLGVCNDTLFVEAPIGEYLDEFEKNMDKSYDPEMPKKTIEGVKALLTVVKEAIIKNIPSENFVKETKTVSVNGVDFENASVFSITITKEMAENLAKDVVNGVFEIEFFTNLMSQTDVNLEDAKNEALDSIDFEDFKSVKIHAILDSENKLAGFDIIAEAGNNILALRLASKDGGFTFKAGLLDDKGEFIADEGVVSIDYTFDEATKAEKMVANVNNADGGTVLTIEGTVDGNKREGSFTAVVSEADVEENNTVSFKYALESSDDTLVLNIKDIAVSGMTIPVDLTLSLSGDENNLKASLAVKLSMLLFAEVDATLEIAFELSEVEISVPSEFVNVNDITEADTTQWLADIQTKYSNITVLIGQFADLFAPAEDYPMEDDFTVEYDDEELLYGDSLVA